jgi:predicted Zn-dependent protease
MDNEAQLAALLGHELGHVTARHTAQQMSRSMLTSLVISGLGAGLSIADKGQYAGLVTGLGGIGAGALLAHYSRDHERQADALGMEYMTKAGYSPEGMVGLMDILRQKSKRQPSALETMFSTHPMSSERYATARERARSRYGAALGNPVFKERYLDRTAGLRKIAPAIGKMQDGEKLMAQQKFQAAEARFREALAIAPNDYAGLVLQSKALLAQKKHAAAEKVLARAKEVYPQEAQAYHFAGVNSILRNDFDAAAQSFARYERLLPGNPITDFLQGLAFEGMGRKRNAAEKYIAFLNQVNQGEQAKYAYTRLKQWGFVR